MTILMIIPIRALPNNVNTDGVIQDGEFPHRDNIREELYLEIDFEYYEELRKQEKIEAEAKVKAEAEARAQEEIKMEALVNATYILETGHGKSRLWREQFNAGGIKCGTKYCVYGSAQEGWQALRNLLGRYVEAHGYNLKAIRDIYSETDDTLLFTSIYNKQIKILRQGV